MPVNGLIAVVSKIISKTASDYRALIVVGHETYMLLDRGFQYRPKVGEQISVRGKITAPNKNRYKVDYPILQAIQISTL